MNVQCLFMDTTGTIIAVHTLANDDNTQDLCMDMNVSSHLKFYWFLCQFLCWSVYTPQCGSTVKYAFFSDFFLTQFLRWEELSTSNVGTLLASFSLETSVQSYFFHFSSAFLNRCPFGYYLPIASYATLFAAKWSSNGWLVLWFQSDLLKVTKVWLLTAAFFILFFSAKCVFVCFWQYYWARDEGLA